MTILGICSNVDILRAVRIIRLIIRIIKIVVPLILIISCMIEVVNAVTSQDDITSKMLASWARKSIAAVLIFLIPTFINLLANISSFSTGELSTCIKDSTTQRISELSVDEANKYIAIARNTLTNADYNAAYRKVFKIKDKSIRQPLNDKLAVIGEYVDLRNQIFDIARNTHDRKKAKSLKEKIEAITEEDIKERLLKDFDDNIKLSDVGWWWPVGSNSTTVVGGVTIADGAPASTRVTATFGGNDKVHQGLGGGHGAVDIASYKENIIASKSGTVIYPGPGDSINYPDQFIKPDENGKYNCKGLKSNYVIIKHEDGFTTQYNHLYQGTITVRAGDFVEQGQVIGLSGSSGCSTGGHLHFQMELNGTKVDPLLYISADNPRP